MSTPPDSPAPLSRAFERDARGLIKGVDYFYTPEGLVDYRRMVSPRFLYVAREHEAKVIQQQNKPLAEIDLLAVRDEWLRIRIGGINQLAQLRGYTDLNYSQFQTREGFAAVVCSMTFIGNYETSHQPFTCSAIASATMRSVDRNFTPYLETFAENRAFSRCVKRALQLNILADIEIGGDGRDAAKDNGSDAEVHEAVIGTAPGGFEPKDELARLCAAQKTPITFEALKTGALKYVAELKSNPAEWTGFDSIQPIDAYVLINKIRDGANKVKAGQR